MFDVELKEVIRNDHRFDIKYRIKITTKLYNYSLKNNHFFGIKLNLIQNKSWYFSAEVHVEIILTSSFFEGFRLLNFFLLYLFLKINKAWQY